MAAKSSRVAFRRRKELPAATGTGFGRLDRYLREYGAGALANFLQQRLGVATDRLNPGAGTRVHVALAHRPAE